MLLLPFYMNAQQITGTEKDEIYLSSRQIVGYSFIGLGAGELIYTSQYNGGILSRLPNKTFDYILGSTMVATGICFLIFGDKEKDKMKPWQRLPDSGNLLKRNFLCASQVNKK